MVRTRPRKTSTTSASAKSIQPPSRPSTHPIGRKRPCLPKPVRFARKPFARTNPTRSPRLTRSACDPPAQRTDVRGGRASPCASWRRHASQRQSFGVATVALSSTPFVAEEVPASGEEPNGLADVLSALSGKNSFALVAYADEGRRHPHRSASGTRHEARARRFVPRSGRRHHRTDRTSIRQPAHGSRTAASSMWE